MQNTMPMYYNYIKETVAFTFLPQHLAMCRTTVNKCERYFVVLRNVFSPVNKVSKKFDLKVQLLVAMQPNQKKQKSRRH